MVTRRKFMLAAMFVFLCLSPAGILSQESETGPGDLPLTAKMTGQFVGGLRGLYFSADPSVVWKPGLLAIGIGTELIVGMSQFDLYLFPYLRAEVGWVHLDFGYVLPLVGPPAGDGLAGLSAGFGIAPEPFQVAYGRLGFDLGLDVGFTVYTDAYRALSGASAAQRIIVPVLLAGRLGFGVTYSFTLL